MKKRKVKDFSYNLVRSLYPLWYYHYIKMFPFMNRRRFSRIVKGLMKEYQNQILTNPHGIKLDYNLGEISAEWVPTNLQRKESSIVTNFKLMKIVYRIRDARKRNKYIAGMAFEAAREMKILISNSCIENGEIYKNARRIK